MNRRAPGGGQVWVGPAVTNEEETEVERLRQMDVWIGGCRLLGTVAFVALYAFMWFLTGERSDFAWVFVAAFATINGALWLLGRSFSREIQERLGWASLIGDAFSISAAGRVTGVPYDVWMPVWCFTTVYYVERFGRPAGYAVCALAGVTTVAHHVLGAAPPASPVQLLREGIIFVCIGVLAWVMIRLVEQDRDLRYQLSALAIRDGLTGLYNHRFFSETLDREFSRLGRENGELSVLMIDIDHFKAFNDTWGHIAGDEVLRIVAALLADSVRNHDCVFRYGGEEFAIILPRSGAAAAARVAERAHAKVGTHPFRFRQVTISIGWSTYPMPAGNRADLVRQADSALYMAKQQGRDRAVGFSEDAEKPGACVDLRG